MAAGVVSRDHWGFSELIKVPFGRPMTYAVLCHRTIIFAADSFNVISKINSFEVCSLAPLCMAITTSSSQLIFPRTSPS
jgi:hypothetical protein